MPIGHPKSFLSLIGALAGDLDAGDGIASIHDRSDNVFDRIREARHAIANRASQMVLNRDAANLGQALIDLEITTVG